MPKPNSNREKNLAAEKKRMKKNGKSIFLLFDLSLLPIKRKNKTLIIDHLPGPSIEYISRKENKRRG